MRSLHVAVCRGHEQAKQDINSKRATCYGCDFPARRRVNFEVKPKKGNALIFFPGFMNGELDTDALHAGMPAIDTKWVSQVWIRQSYREDGQPSSPVSDLPTLIPWVNRIPFTRITLSSSTLCPCLPPQVPDSERTLIGPLHRGFYRGHCLAGDDLLESVMTVEEAIEWASKNPQCYGFTYNSADKDVRGPIRIWFKSKLNVLYNESWWTYSTGLGME